VTDAVTAERVKVKDLADTVFTGGPLGFITSNSPARSIGAEIETAWQVSHAFQLNGNASYVDATNVIQPITAAGALQVDGAGNPVYGTYRRSQAPKVIFNIGAHYSAPLGPNLEAHFNANVRRRTRMFNQRRAEFLSPKLTTDINVKSRRV
jgi:iron complex outermembrane receptor protein